MMARDLRVGYVGLGDIGHGMAANLARAPEIDLTVFDTRSDAVAALAVLGAHAAADVAELALQVDVLHICVADAEQLRAVLFGERGFADGARSGQVVVLHSTVSPMVVRECAEALDPLGVAVLDAPISGGHDGAEAGTLTIMVGGDEQVFIRVEPVLRLMGSLVTRVGPLGSGEVMKLANNVMSMGNRLLYLEALRLAEAHGISEEALNEVVSASTGASWAQQNIGFLDLHGVRHTDAGTAGHPVRFSKDLRQIAALASEQGIPMPITGLLAQIAPEEFRKRWAKRREQ